jgi:putative two-component system response regulator
MTEILIVDDEAEICQLLMQMLTSRGYDCATAGDAAEARRMLENTAFDLILCDVNMPGESGLDLIRDILPDHPETAAIMVTGVDDHIVAEKFFNLGVYDYLTKPVERTKVLISVTNALRRQELERASLDQKADLELQVAERTQALERTLATQQQTLVGMVHAIATIVEIRDPYTAGHQRRVAELAKAIAEHLGMTAAEIEGVYLGGLIHDVGKIAIPAEILAKPGRLSKIEFELIKLHPTAGQEIVKDIPFKWPISDIVLQHHEKMDGSGYPQQLSGTAICPAARIICVADVVEAMASHRPYRAALGIEFALQEIWSKCGQSYDSDAVHACLDLFEKYGYRLS